MSNVFCTFVMNCGGNLTKHCDAMQCLFRFSMQIFAFNAFPASFILMLGIQTPCETNQLIPLMCSRIEPNLSSWCESHKSTGQSFDNQLYRVGGVGKFFELICFHYSLKTIQIPWQGILPGVIRRHEVMQKPTGMNSQSLSFLYDNSRLFPIQIFIVEEADGGKQ